MTDKELIQTLRIAANATDNFAMRHLLELAANRIIEITDENVGGLTTIPREV